MAELTHDAAEDGFHEIQLSGKQLGFLFMLTTSVLALVFLLGVQVGRGVRAEQAPIDAGPSASSDPATTSSTPSAPPIDEAPAPGTDPQLRYPKLDSDKPSTERIPATKAEEPPAPAVEAPPPVPDNASPSAPPAKPEVPAAASTAVPAAETARNAPNVPTSGRAGRWVVQVITLSNQAGAADITQRLIGKGYPAFLNMPARGTPALYRVQVGRFNDRAEADKVVRRLAQEKPAFTAEVKR